MLGVEMLGLWNSDNPYITPIQMGLGFWAFGSWGLGLVASDAMRGAHVRWPGLPHLPLWAIRP